MASRWKMAEISSQGRMTGAHASPASGRMRCIAEPFKSGDRERAGSGGVARGGPAALMLLVGRGFPGEQAHDVRQRGEVPVCPVPALVGTFFQVLLFGEALRRSMGNPLSKFFATAFYLAKFYALICHLKLDARVPKGIYLQFAGRCSRAWSMARGRRFLRC